MRLGANHTNEHRMRENSMPKLRDVIGGTHTKIYRQATVCSAMPHGIQLSFVAITVTTISVAHKKEIY